MQAAFAGEIGAFFYFFILLYTPCGAAIKMKWVLVGQCLPHYRVLR
jgi:hypothetical protein